MTMNLHKKILLVCVLAVFSCSKPASVPEELSDIHTYYDIQFENMNVENFAAVMNRHVSFCRWNDFGQGQLRVTSSEKRLDRAKEFAEFVYIRAVKQQDANRDELCRYLLREKRCIRIHTDRVMRPVFADLIISPSSIPDATLTVESNYLYIEYFLSAFRDEMDIVVYLPRGLIDDWIIDSSRRYINVIGYDQTCLNNPEQ